MSAQATIPKHVNFRRAALDSAAFDGTLSLGELSRTRDVVVPGSEATIQVALAFGEDNQRRVFVTGQVTGTLSLACQRCLEPADVAIDTAVAGMVVTSDDAASNVPRQWEPVLIDGERLDLHGLVDDELLLALPITVHCDRPACRETLAQYSTDHQDLADEASADLQKSNPFAALAELKSRSNDPD